MEYQRIYQVIRYNDKRVLIEGTKEECMEYLGVSKKQFEDIVCQKEFSNGKTRGWYIDYIGDNTNEILEYNKKLLHRFFDEYWRSPTREEFRIIGGNDTFAYGRHGGWKNFLKAHNFPLTRGDSIEVYEDGELIFIGTAQDIAEEIGFNHNTIKRYAKYGIGFNNYTFKIRQFVGLPKEKGEEE